MSKRWWVRVLIKFAVAMTLLLGPTLAFTYVPEGGVYVLGLTSGMTWIVFLWWYGSEEFDDDE